jgi:hypothetical protein
MKLQFIFYLLFPKYQGFSKLSNYAEVSAANLGINLATAKYIFYLEKECFLCFFIDFIDE